MSAGDITLLVEEPGWRKTRGLTTRLTEAAQVALKAAGFKGKSALTILLSNDARLKALNRDFRGKNKPTNVLSFPAADNAGNYRGDIALALGVTQKEARESGKAFGDHASHLVVHGVLHLAGHDHEQDADAQRMEALEVKILKGMGISDPYKATA